MLALLSVALGFSAVGRVGRVSLRMSDAAAPAPPVAEAPATPSAPKVAAKEFSRSLPFLLKPKNLDGMIGNAEFDPLGLAETFDPKWLRESEIKHGRVSMLAISGWLFQSAGFHLPGEAYETSNPIDAFFAVGPSPILQIILGVGAMEWYNHNGKMTMEDMHEDSSREVGEFSAPIYGAKTLAKKSPEHVADMKLKELQNGRLAMLAIGGAVHHQIIYGSEFFGSFPNEALWKGLAVNIPTLYH